MRKMSKSQYLECGKIINTHGVRGGLKLESWCDTPADLASLKKVFLKEGKEYVCHKVKRASVFKQFVLFEIEGVNDIDAANALRGRIVYADREDINIDEDGFFIADIIGLPVIDADSGRVYGKVKDVTDSPASRLYVIDTPTGEVLLPGVKEFVKRVDTESGVYITPIPGFFGDGDEI